IPLVGLQTYLPGSTTIDADDRFGTRTLVEYLISLGHRRIAYLTDETSTYVLNERMRGYQDALAEHGIDFDPSLVYRFNEKHNSFETTLDILNCPNPPTAIHCQNDHEALSAYIAITSKGLRIPEQISLSGYDNLPNSRLVQPPLTTVEQPLQRMGMAAVELLDDLIRNPSVHPTPRQIVYSTQLIVRGSTAAPLQSDKT
ncbi:MAG: substrate-binding domain-containing protein, partial [Clostridia bacterium]|nr:substrate-binding domain-containing protein [Clostridia bacterium]